MKRRSDRGEVDGLGTILACVLCVAGLIACVFWQQRIMHRDIRRAEDWHDNAHCDLQRIIRAVCVYAPPAVPAEQSAANPLVGRVAVLRGYGAGRYTVARITGVCTRPTTGVATPFVEYSAYFIEAAECRSGSGGCTLRLFRENLIGFLDRGRHGLELVGIEQSAVPAEEMATDGD